MQKLFDKILSEKIKRVFNSHQETYNPADWGKLKERLTGQKRGVIIWMHIAKAASVVLFVGVSTIYLNKNDKTVLAKAKNTKVSELQIAENRYTKTGQISKQIKKQRGAEYKKTEQTIGVHQKTQDVVDFNTKSIQVGEDTHTVVNPDSIKPERIIAITQNKKNDSLVQSLQTQLATHEHDTEKKKHSSKFRFAVGIASIYSSATQATKGSINMGGGFTASYNLSKKISISTGMLVAKQSVDYNNTGNLLYANTADRYENTASGLNDKSSANSQIEFVGMDIPLNIKYKIKNLIITTGISSLIYISEKKTYTTNKIVSNTTFNSATGDYETVSTFKNMQVEENTPAFSKMDLAGLLNFSIAYQLALSKGSIRFEPFIKYPIGEISSANLKIASGGMSVQYYF